MTTKDSARKFQFIREIASGGFGSVYLAKVIHADGFSRLCAVKLLHRKWSENEEIASRMRDEARLLGWLRHRNIVDVMDLTLIDGRCAVVMEYLEAVDARLIIEQARELDDEVPVRVALEICACVASALDAAYNRPPYAGEKPLHVIHRDIKPSNIMIDELGTVKVLDFGVARAEFDAREARTAELSFGSLEYMPPERLFFEPESPASDVYSLGTTLFELLAVEKLGKAKLRMSEQERFLAERLDDLLGRRRALDDEVSERLRTLLQGMLAFDEGSRPSAADCVTEMRAFSRDLGAPSLEEWAEGKVAGLLEVSRMRETGEGATLVGKLVTEDVTGFTEDTTQLDEQATPDPRAAAMLVDIENMPDTDPAEFDTGHDDARWSALKQATLASLSETGELSPQTVEEVRRAGLFDDSDLGLDDTQPDDDDAMPTVRIRAPGRIPAADSTTARLDDLELVAPRNLYNEETQRMTPEEARGGGAPPVQRFGPPSTPPHVIDDGGGRGWLGIVVSVLLAVSVLGVLLLVGVIVVGGGFAAWWSSTPVVVQPVPVPLPPAVPADVPAPPAPPAPPPAPIAPTPAPAPAEPDAVADPDDPDGAPVAAELPGPVFESRLPGTRKMKVQCDRGSASGTDEVALTGDVGSCTVTAVDGSRRRRTAVLEGVEPRRYVCFVSDDTGCQ